jgi:hypothetical protein
MPRGRPSKLEQPGIRDKLLEAIRFGVPAAIAAESVGVSPSAFHEWVQRGKGKHGNRKADQLYVDFADQVREARARAVSSYQLTHAKVALGQTVKREVRRVTMSEDGVTEEVVEREFHPPHVGALQWWLERRVPDYYGATLARDADTADPDEVIPPDAADLDPEAALDRLSGLIDRYAPALPAQEGDTGGLQAPGGD